jgi:hypothetical protein
MRIKFETRVMPEQIVKDISGGPRSTIRSRRISGSFWRGSAASTAWRSRIDFGVICVRNYAPRY